MNIAAPASRRNRFRMPWLALGIALSSLAAAQSAPEAGVAPTNPNLGPAFATRNAAYVPVLFEEIPGWEDESFEETHAGFTSNCKAMKRRSAWAPVCAKFARLPKDEAALRAFMHDEFYAYQMLTPTRGATGKLTGYFEPLIAGSLRSEGAYKYPVYGIPNDMYMVDSRTVAGQSSRWLKVSQGKLVGAEAGAAGARQYTLELAGSSPNSRDKRYRVRIVGDTVRPYYTRKQIDANGIDAPVLAWVADAYKLYSMQIQGSGKIQLKDGGLIRLAYAEQNGYPFMPNATRGDSDAMLLAIKARALMEPEAVDMPGGTRGARKSGASSATDDEVARIVAALSGGGSGASSSPRPATAKAKPPTKKSAPKRPRPAAAEAVEDREEIAVESSDVEAMIQLLLTAPVADESEYTPVEDAAGEQVATPTNAPRPAKSTASGKPAPRMDMSEFEGKGGGKGAGQAVGSGKAVPATGIHDPSYVFFRRIGDGPEGPIGALGVPLSAGRSMAVDPRATPLGAPVFIDGQQPGGKGPMRRLVFAQDTGGAIRGSVRGDFFWGFGDKAGRMALQTNQPVKMWLLLPKAVAGSAAASGIKTRSLGGVEALRDCAVPDEEFCVEDDGSTLDELLPGQ
jgi:membrane-bound lytic murein transglycosylase A